MSYPIIKTIKRKNFHKIASPFLKNIIPQKERIKENYKKYPINIQKGVSYSLL